MTQPSSATKNLSARVQLADGHLTYIGSRVWRAGETRYDVYPRDGGHQLGWVVKYGKEWTATSDDPTVDDVTGRTRWEAATNMWGHSRD